MNPIIMGIDQVIGLFLKWWTEGPPVRSGIATHEEQVIFYDSKFVRKILGHEGGITTLPQPRMEVNSRI